ncbi:oxaloacetate decarboxylase [Polynucleobacter sp. MWH-UH25E]|uniref:isocitrate lyase/PEP mutase family protein n=1 Tax=Polynucleobacter sp. MWH-UH25E TaxID=1855616 RepID=UPI001BFD4350|nr:oxaloacetate decarboxylase [Polynucleobacter sp. MWH-UH25E]QWD61433.1 oxaloacetate decarboxylase [Polynucleobacter sp. MWH-UH25E]
MPQQDGSTHLGTKLRRLINERRGLLVPGAGNALAARVIEDAGFEAVYLSGAGLTNQFYGIPDLGFISLNDVASHTAAIRDVIQLPLIVDIDVGFGNAVNVHHTIKVLERSGANAVQIEDQAMPKRCGHFAGKSIISKEEMCGKIKAAADARVHDDFLIIARTDARSINGLQDALDRAQAYAQAGADMTFIEAPESVEEMKIIAAQTNCPQLINMVIGGKTPSLPQQELAQMGFGIVLYANAALQGAVHGMNQALNHLKQTGELKEDPNLVATFAQRQSVVKKEDFDALEKKFS